MIVEHHTVPFTPGNTFIIMLGQPTVFFHKRLNGKRVAHCRIIVYLSHPCTADNWIIHQLVEGVLRLIGQSGLKILAAHYQRLPQGIGVKHLILVEYSWILHFRFAP